MSLHTYEAVEQRVLEMLQPMDWDAMHLTALFLHDVKAQGGLTVGELDACWVHYWLAKNDLTIAEIEA